MARLTAGLAVATLLCAACASSAPAAISSPSASPAALPTAVVRVGEPIDARSRTACATRVLTVLVDAVNARDEMAIGHVIAPGPSLSQAFQWVSFTSGGVNKAEYGPEGARRMLLQHAAQGERWTLGASVAGDGPSWHGGVDAEIHFERQLADGRVVKTGGKTALSCIGSAIYVLGLADE